MIYLDYAASTPVLSPVVEKLNEVLSIYGNPSSLHSQGETAHKIIDDAKEIISHKLCCKRDEIYFTSGATMSNNTVLQGFRGKVFVSDVEHEDIQMLATQRGFERIQVNNEGYIDMDILRDELERTKICPSLFSIQMANGEIGTIQNIKEISDLIHSYPESYLHVDATQYIPYYPVNIQEYNIDALSMSGQKIGCIKGVGLLYVSSTLLPLIRPLIYGEQGLVGGTENVPGIACLGKAFECLTYENIEMQRLRDKLINNLNGLLIGPKDNRLPNNVNMMFEGIPSESLVYLLDEHGICCSSGSACSSKSNEPSHVLLAIGKTIDEANSCCRFTLGQETTEQEIDIVIKEVNTAINLLGGKGL